MSVRSIVVTKINPDLISGSAASVVCTFFDHQDNNQMSIPLPGKLFPKDIQIGDRVVFIQEDKFNQLLTVEIREK